MTPLSPAPELLDVLTELWGRLLRASLAFGLWSTAASQLVYGPLLGPAVAKAFAEHPGVRPTAAYGLRHYVGSYLLHTAMGFMWGAAMTRFIAPSSTAPWMIGVQFGVFSWLVFAVPMTGVKAIWTNYPRQLVMANILYWLLLLVAGGALMGQIVLGATPAGKAMGLPAVVTP